MKILQASLLFLLGFFAFYGCSENGNNPVEGVSSFDAGISSSELYIESSSSEEIYSSSSSENDPLLSSSEDGLSSSSGIDYSNWVLKKEIYWVCEDTLCINKSKFYETNYDYTSYTDPEHYTVLSDYRSTSGSLTHKIWNYYQTTTTRNGLNYSGTEIRQRFTPDSLTLSYKEEYNYTSVHHPILTTLSIYYSTSNGTKTYYENGEIVKTEYSMGSVSETSVIDLGIIDGSHCYKYDETSISCHNSLGGKSEGYNMNGDLSSMLITTYNETLSTGEFAIWTGIIEGQMLVNNVWTEYESIREIIEQTSERIVIINKTKNSITEQHYGLP